MWKGVSNTEGKEKRLRGWGGGGGRKKGMVKGKGR